MPAGTSNTPLTRVSVTGSTGAESVIFDFTDGLFAQGTAASNGISVDLGAGTQDMLGLRLGALDDSVIYGSSGVVIINSASPSDTFRDIVATNVEFSKVLLGAGDDSVSASGNTATGGVFVPAGTLEMYGGEGDDTFLQGNTKTPRGLVSGGNGSDRVDYSGRTGGLNVTISASNVASANDGDLSSTAASPPEADDIKDDIESILGTPGNDSISGGGSQGILIIGGLGSDSLSGGLGPDTLNGGAGNDRFFESAGTSGADVFIGSDGVDTIDYSSRVNDLVCSLDGVAEDGEPGELDNVFADIENVIGGAGNDSITGSKSKSGVPVAIRQRPAEPVQSTAAALTPQPAPAVPGLPAAPVTAAAPPAPARAPSPR